MRLAELALCAALLAALPAAQAAPTREEVQQAAEKVRAHPDLGGTRAEKSLRFKKTDQPQPSETRTGDELDWLRQLARWLTETARLLVWLGGAVLVALVLVGLRRWARARGGFAATARAHLPSHVQSLDIRPESLPEAIGEAAAQLWQGGQQQAALSLLYRGALSRLVHAHAVPIRAASTEGECMALAHTRLDAQRNAFFARLVAAWQLAVYGARLPDAPQALALCRDFDLQWPPPATAAGRP